MCRDRIESDVGKENDCRARQHPQRLPTGIGLAENRLAEKVDARVTVRRERMPVRGINIERAHYDNKNHNRDFENHHRSIETRTLFDTDDQHYGHQRDDHHGRQIEKFACGD